MKNYIKKGICTIMVLFLFAALYSCNENNNISSESTKSGTAALAAASSESSSSSGSKEYLKTDPSKGEAYNVAIKAYNEFLSGKINAKNKNADNVNKTININDMTKAGNSRPGIDSFALLDMNGDGIPELHTRSMAYDLFSYQDNQVVLWYEAGLNLMDGSAYPLENRALFTKHDTTGTFYEYTTFGPDGTAATISFSEPALVDVAENAPYYFNDKEVSKEEYDNLTKEYIALSKNPASIEWYDYEQ